MIKKLALVLALFLILGISAAPQRPQGPTLSRGLHSETIEPPAGTPTPRLLLMPVVLRNMPESTPSVLPTTDQKNSLCLFA